MTMAKPTTLTEMNTGEALYPVTLASLVRTADGGNVDEGLAKAGRALFIELWKEACAYYERVFKVSVGRYDPSLAKPFVMNRIEMNFQEAWLVYELSFRNALSLSSTVTTGTSPTPMASGAFLYYRMAGLRTVFPVTAYRAGGRGLSCHAMFAYSSIESFRAIRFTDYEVYSSTFAGCAALHTVVFTKSTSKRKFTSTFGRCRSLVTVEIANLCEDISFADSPLLSRESISYMVAHRHGEDPFTMTVHPDVYAKLTGDTTNAAAAALTEEEAAAWQQVIATAAEKNITFATI